MLIFSCLVMENFRPYFQVYHDLMPVARHQLDVEQPRQVKFHENFLRHMVQTITFISFNCNQVCKKVLISSITLQLDDEITILPFHRAQFAAEQQASAGWATFCFGATLPSISRFRKLMLRASSDDLHEALKSSI